MEEARGVKEEQRVQEVQNFIMRSGEEETFGLATSGSPDSCPVQ